MLAVFGPIYYIFLEHSFCYGHLLYVTFLKWNYFVAVTIKICVELWFGFVLWGTYITMLQVNLSYILIFKTATMQLIDKNFDIRKCTKIYSKLRILSTLYNNSYGMYYVPLLKANISMLMVLGALLSIRLADKQKDDKFAFILCGAFFFGFTGAIIIAFISFAAMVHQSSVKLKIFLQRQNKGLGKLNRCLMKNFKIEAVSSGGMYDIEKFTCVTVLGFLSNLIASALMSFNI